MKRPVVTIYIVLAMLVTTVYGEFIIHHYSTRINNTTWIWKQK